MKIEAVLIMVLLFQCLFSPQQEKVRAKVLLDLVGINL